MALSQWVRARLRQRLAVGDIEFTYVVPNSLPGGFYVEPRAREILAELIDVVVAHEPTGRRAHVDVRFDRTPAGGAVLRVHREGGRSCGEIASCVAEWDRRARLLGGSARADDSGSACTALLELPIRETRPG